MTTTVRLRPPRNELDRRAVNCWRTALALWVAAPVVVLGALAVLLPPAAPWLLTGLALVLLPGLPAVALLPRWWYRTHRWERTDTAVYVRGGYFWQTWRFAPLSRIQTVDTQRGPLQQRFGLSTITVTTASAKGPLTISGLDADLATEVAAQLTEATQATPGDAT